MAMKHISDKDKDKRSKKEWRKPYRRSKSFDPSCRNHGSCYWCQSNRTHQDQKSRKQANDEMDNWYKE